MNGNGAGDCRKSQKNDGDGEVRGSGGVVVEEEGESVEVEYGMRRPMKKGSPVEPSKEEREEHMKLHLPFRSWCRDCVAGRGKEEACRKVGRSPEGVPEIHMDFMFMGEEKGDGALAMLVVRERGTRAVMGCVAPRKSSGEWLGKRVMAFMREFGCEVG